MSTSALKFVIGTLSDAQIAERRLQRRMKRAYLRHKHWLGERGLTAAHDVAAELFNRKQHVTFQARRAQTRVQIRSMLLAYAFLRGVPYVQVEQRTYTQPNWSMVEIHALANSHEDTRVVKQRFAAWKDAAPAVLSRPARQHRQRVSNGAHEPTIAVAA